MNFKRFGLLFLLQLILFAGYHYLANGVRYGDLTGFDGLSDAAFIIGVVGFLPSFAAYMGSFELFYGIRYAFGVLASNRFKKQYPNYRDFVAEKSSNRDKSLFLEVMLVSIVFIIASIIFLMLWAN